MKNRIFNVFILLLCIPNFGYSTTWHVGSSQTYTLPSQVSSLVQNGDTVEIDAGIYQSDVAHWTANNLVLTGINGMAHMKSGGLTFGDKAIWVISGDNTSVINIEFSEATSTSNNGAGIRQEGHNLLVKHCNFHNNEDGILAGTVNPSNILIEFCEFGYNGYGDGYSHNLYINNIDTLFFISNYSHHTSVGHELKSRAHVNYIYYNRISNEDSTASRDIDLPNGGIAYIIGNVIEKGPLAQNSNVIGFGLEGLSNPTPHELYAINNTIVSDRSNTSFFDVANGTAVFKAYNNIIAGAGNFMTATMPTSLDTAGNMINTSIASFAFVDAPQLDYHLTSASTSVIDQGVPAGFAHTTVLAPDREYFFPDSIVGRCQSGNLDIGAFELCSTTSIHELSNENFTVSPNPSSDKISIHTSEKQVELTIYDITGNLITSYDDLNLPATLSTEKLAAGIYILRINNNGFISQKKIVIASK